MESAGAQLVAVPARLEDFQIDFAALEAALSPQVKGVIINSPNNPTGVVYSQETIRRLAQMLGEKSRAYGHPIWLISDEPYREIAFEAGRFRMRRGSTRARSPAIPSPRACRFPASASAMWP